MQTSIMKWAVSGVPMYSRDPIDMAMNGDDDDDIEEEEEREEEEEEGVENLFMAMTDTKGAAPVPSEPSTHTPTPTQPQIVMQTPRFYFSNLTHVRSASRFTSMKTETETHNLARLLMHNQTRGGVPTYEARNLYRTSMAMYRVLPMLIPPRPLPEDVRVASKYRIEDIAFDQYGELLACANGGGHLVVWNYEEYLDSLAALQRQRESQRSIQRRLDLERKSEGDGDGEGEDEDITDEPGLRVLFDGDPSCCIALGNSVQTLSWNPVNPAMIACGYARHNEIHIYNLETCPRYGRGVPSVQITSNGVCRSGVRTLRYLNHSTGRGSVFATVGYDGSLAVWDLRTGRGPKQVASGLSARRGRVVSMEEYDHSGSGNYVYCGTDMGGVHLFDLRQSMQSVLSVSVCDLPLTYDDNGGRHGETPVVPGVQKYSTAFVNAMRSNLHFGGSGTCFNWREKASSMQGGLHIQSLLPHPTHRNELGFQMMSGVCGVIDMASRCVRVVFFPSHASAEAQSSAVTADTDIVIDASTTHTPVTPIIPSWNHKPTFTHSTTTSSTLDTMAAAHMGSVYLIDLTKPYNGSLTDSMDRVIKHVPLSGCSGVVAGHARSGTAVIGMSDGGLRVIGGRNLFV